MYRAGQARLALAVSPGIVVGLSPAPGFRLYARRYRAVDNYRPA
ncbi:MAG: hypothetical protein QM581_16975 [Pseudomonas sp.]